MRVRENRRDSGRLEISWKKVRPPACARLIPCYYFITGRAEPAGGDRDNDDHRPEQDNDATIARMIRELQSDLADMVEAGDITAEQANEWANDKADQWMNGGLS